MPMAPTAVRGRGSVRVGQALQGSAPGRVEGRHLPGEAAERDVAVLGDQAIDLGARPQARTVASCPGA